MCTLASTFTSILHDGFEGDREPLEVCWGEEPIAEATGTIEDWSIRLVDGFQRSLSVLTIFHYLIKLVAKPGQTLMRSWCSLHYLSDV